MPNSELERVESPGVSDERVLDVRAADRTLADYQAEARAQRNLRCR